MKKCSKCKVEKDYSEYYKNVRSKDGLAYKCKTCSKEDVKYYKRSRPGYHKLQKSNAYEAVRERQYKNRYGITIAEYEEMYVQQQGSCFICRDPHELLCVDHCHTEGHVRGLLCHPCNKSLGGFRDNPDTLRRAAEYVEQNRKSYRTPQGVQEQESVQENRESCG